MAEIASEQARLAADRAEIFRRDPATEPDSDVARYYLDTEVLRDDRRAERLWNHLYSHLLDKGAWFDEQRIFELITAAFSPQRDTDGRIRARDAGEIVRQVRDELEHTPFGHTGETVLNDLVPGGFRHDQQSLRVVDELEKEGLDTYGRALEDAHLDLQRALELEARYSALLDQGADLQALQEQAGLDEAVRAVDSDEVRRRVLDKLQRVVDECVILAHLDRTRMDDPTVVPARIFYAGVAPRYDTDEPHALAKLLREVAPGIDLVEGWTEPDAVVLYRAMLGIPTYFFRRVNDELYEAYKGVRDNPRRAYPLHIDAAFEGDGLPDLHPVELKRARERAEAEARAVALKQEEERRLRAFTLCALLGVVSLEEGQYRWAMKGVGKPLATTRGAAFAAFWRLDPTLRGDMLAEAERQLTARRAEAPDRRKLAVDIRAGIERLSALYYQALADEQESERRHLEAERTSLQVLLSEVEG